jgi:alpha-L-fucosidase
VSQGIAFSTNNRSRSKSALDDFEEERDRAIDNWLKINNEAIQGAGPTSFGAETGANDLTRKDRRDNPVFVAAWDWRCTTKPGKLFIHLFKWPDGKFDLTAMKGTVSKAYLLADPSRTPLKVSQVDDKVSIALPATAPDAVASVLCLEVGG